MLLMIISPTYVHVARYTPNSRPKWDRSEKLRMDVKGLAKVAWEILDLERNYWILSCQPLTAT
jgi:hypothetical protein